MEKTYSDLSWVAAFVETGRTAVRKSKKGEVTTKKKNGENELGNNGNKD